MLSRVSQRRFDEAWEEMVSSWQRLDPEHLVTIAHAVVGRLPPVVAVPVPALLTSLGQVGRVWFIFAIFNDFSWIHFMSMCIMFSNITICNPNPPPLPSQRIYLLCVIPVICESNTDQQFDWTR